MFVEAMKRFSGTPTAYAPYPPAANRAAWENLPAAYTVGVLQRAEAALGRPYPPLTATLYMEYTRTGNRSGYETPYLTRRRMLNDFIMAECVEHGGRFMDAVIDGIVSVCEETSWCLPAHLAACATGPVKSGFPNPEYPALDLFAAETGSQIALALYLLREELNAAAPELCLRMEGELLHRIVRPFLDKELHWMRLDPNEPRQVSNWTPWCTMNCLLTMFTLAAMPEPILSEEDLRAALQKAAVGMEAYYNATGEDGCCTEGVRYYRHGALGFFVAAQLMHTVTDGALQALLKMPKYKNMAAYVYTMHIGGEYYCNFNDCPQRPGACGAEEYLFAKTVGNEPMRRDMARDIAAHGYALRTAASQNLFYHIEMAFAAQEICEAAGLPALQPEDIFYPSTGIWVVRRGSTYLAVKGGHNGEPHNHNDVGTLTLFYNEKPVLIDIGVEAYSKATFSADRYSLWTMNSAHHNVLTFGEVQQFAGKDAAAIVLQREKGDSPEISMELAGAYPPEAGVRSWIRRVRLEGDGAVLVEDTLDALPDGTYLTLMTADEPVVQGNTLRIGGMLLTAEGLGEEGIMVETCPLSDALLRESWQRDALYQVKLFPAGPRLAFSAHPLK